VKGREGKIGTRGFTDVQIATKIYMCVQSINSSNKSKVREMMWNVDDER